MYRGFWASAWRDIPGWAVYFWAYDILKDLYKSNDSLKQMAWTINSGGLAGLISWVIAIPQDIIKNK